MDNGSARGGWLRRLAGEEFDVVIRFDGSGAKQLQEKEAALKQAQATLEQAEAEARITAGGQAGAVGGGYDLKKRG